MNIEGVAAVTGASRGIGLATSIELANRGYDVLALVESEEMVDKVRRAAPAVSVRVLDVRNVGDFEFPANLSVLVNNAGVRREYLPVEHIDPADWRDIFEVNVFGMAELSRRAIPILRERGSGTICNVTSSAVLDLGPFFGAYRCSKAAASALSEELRLELAPFGVRVVEILPGPTTTAMARNGVAAQFAEAVRYPAYEPMARRQRDLQAAVTEWASTEEVAAAIADAINDDRGPMRYGTDALSRRRLTVWRQVDDDEKFMGAALERYC